MREPSRRWLPPRDLDHFVVILAALMSVCLVVSVGALVWGVLVYLPGRDLEIQAQRIDGARAQCRLAAEVGVDLTACVERVCVIVEDVDGRCDRQKEMARARN